MCRSSMRSSAEAISRSLFAWLRTNVHALGAKVTLQELMKAATGKPLSAVAFVRYVENKYLDSPASSAAA